MNVRRAARAVRLLWNWPTISGWLGSELGPCEWRVMTDLVAVLSSLADRRVRIGEIIDALGVGRSTYYEQRDEGRLLSADNLLRLAGQFDLNPVELLLHCELISRDAVADCAEKLGIAGIAAKSARQPRARIFQRRPEAPPL